MTGKLFRPGADSDSSESWNRNRFWLMSMVESQSESFGIVMSRIMNRDTRCRIPIPHSFVSLIQV